MKGRHWCGWRLVLPLFLVGVLIPAGDPEDRQESKPPSPPERHVDLADWGFEKASDIGYVSLGIIHKKEGDEMVVYDIRRRRPRLKPTPAPRGKIPPFEGDVFMVDDFESGNTNSLGGYFNRFHSPPSRSHATIEEAPDGRRSLCFSYEKKAEGYAGFWIHFYDLKSPPEKRVFLDARPFRYLTFGVHGEKGGERVEIRVADYTWEMKQDSRSVGEVSRFLPERRVTRSWQQAWIPLEAFPPDIRKDELASLVFLAQKGQSRVYVRDVAFTTRENAPLPVPKKTKPLLRPLRLGMWVWETEPLCRSQEAADRFLRFCEERALTDVFLQLPYKAEKTENAWEIRWDKAAVKALILRLHKAGVRVHALDGDPRFALEPWHRLVLAVCRSVAAYNRTVPPEQRFDGIRFDNEPYLLEEFPGVRKQRILRQYLLLLERIREAIDGEGLEFGVDIPFWFDEANAFFEPLTVVDERPLSEHVLDIVDNIGIMDYRTEAYGADGVIAHAFGEIRYASANGKSVFVGLETTEIPDEILLEFGKGRGPTRLLLEDLRESRVRLRWLPEDSPPAADGVFLFQTNRVLVPAEKLSFSRKNPVELFRVMEKVRGELSGYPGFCGFAIHAYESFRVLIERERPSLSPVRDRDAGFSWGIPFCRNTPKPLQSGSRFRP